MKLKNLKVIIVFCIFLIAFSFFFLHKNIGNNNKFISTISKIIPDNTKEILRNTIFVFNTNKNLKRTIQERQNKIDELKDELETLNIQLIEITSGLTQIPLKKLDKKININKEDYSLEKFQTSNIITSKFPGSKANSYLEFYKENLILTSANGIFAHIKLDKLRESNQYLNVIKSNINDIITYNEFYLPSSYGIKDILIIDNSLYVSFINQLKKDCFNTSILVADLNLNKLEFSKFFEPKECIDKINDFPNELGPHNSGGRMVKIKNNKILLTVGDYEYMTKAQQNNSVFGKILSIDLSSGEYEILAKGVRNSQGLNYLEKENVIFFSDHGPQGGDEVNYFVLDENKNNNFGWPVASYGEHYGGKDVSYNMDLYKVAPLKKSHHDNGFSEPITYYNPSIATSEIIVANDNFIENTSNPTLILSSLGQNTDEGDMSLHILVLDQNYNKIKTEQIILNERIRDMQYLSKTNELFLFLESTGSIGIIKKLQ